MNEKRTMLIVDDVEIHREILESAFAEDYTVLPAADGVKALEIIKGEKIDVLITDIYMDQMDGMELIRQVRRIPAFASLPIVAVTEQASPARAEVLAAGADELINKPFDLSMIRSQVNNLVISKRSGTAEVFSAIVEKPTGAAGVEGNLQRMMKYIPGGVIMYRWDGKKLEPLFISEYYAKNYASSMLDKGTAAGRPDFQRIHPDDVENLQKAIMNALKTTHKLSYVYRAWDDEAGRYLWKKLNAVSEEPSEDGTCFVYAIYTDVTEEIDAKLEAEKNHEILKASIAASGQFTFEFDPTTNLMVCPPEQAKIFDLPADYIDFPESLFACHGILEEARPVANELMDKLHHGVPEAECELLMYTKGEYLWYRFCFHAWNDPKKGYPIYLCSFTNINTQKVAEEKYIQQMESLAGTASDSLAFSKINLTQNICYVGVSKSDRISSLQQQGHGKLDESFAGVEKFIVDPTEKEQFHNTFALPKLMQDYQNGITHITMQYRFCVSGNQAEWVETIVDLVENPASLEIEGYVSARSINAKKLEEMILQRVIERDYSALIYFDRYSEDYMMFDNLSRQYFVKKQHVYQDGVEVGLCMASEEEKERLRKELTKEIVIANLTGCREYCLYYEGADHHKRYQLSLSNVTGDDRLVVGTLREITDENLLEKMIYKSEHDQLTGLYSREKAFEECNKMLAASPDEAFYMVHFDIQRFRLYNSFFGDAEGDRLLKYLAVMIAKGCSHSPKCAFCRIEADDFMICLPLQSDNDVRLQEQYIRQVLADYRSDFQLLGNMGVYVIKDRSLSAEACYNRAAIAAKNNQNRQVHPVSFFNAAMEHQMNMELEIGSEMQMAVDEEQFVVYLQPKYILLSGEAYGAEALVRWQHPKRGIVYPDSFIPLFETNGFIATLDRYMWEHVCQLIRRWIDEGRGVAPISVNVSRISMYSPQTVPFLKALVKKYDIPIELLNLELTESAYMDNPEEMKVRLTELRDVGFKIMMDDFGSGYSSLNTLRDIPVDYLKVDRAFLASVDRDKRSRLVLASVVHMASRMDIPVITEGVETNEQREFLASIGCDYVQGYLYAKPMPVSEYEARILAGQQTAAPSAKSAAATLSNITINMDTKIQAFADLLPHAVAFVDLVGDEFSYLSANKTFQLAFGMHRDVEDRAVLQAHHISVEHYCLLTRMYRKVADNHIPDECFISWRNNQGCTLHYLVRAQYIGKSAYSSILIASFIDLTEFGHDAVSAVGVAQPFLFTDDSFTLEEVSRYIRLLNRSFDIARLVRPAEMQVISADAENVPVCQPGKCYSFWGKSDRCENCTTLECVKSRQNRCKIEKREDDYYLVASHPIHVHVGDQDKVEGYAIETLTRLTDEILNVLQVGNAAVAEERIIKLQKLVYEDPLTAAYNRRFFYEMAFLKDPEPGYQKGDCVTFALFDLNEFKQINDTFGHSVGDRILIQAAAIMRSRVRPVDSVIRYGGDEFLIVFNNCPENAVRQHIEGICEAIAAIRYAENQSLPVSASIGYSFRQHFAGGIAEAQEMIKEADRSMYAQKRNTRKYNRSKTR